MLCTVKLVKKSPMAEYSTWPRNSQNCSKNCTKTINLDNYKYRAWEVHFFDRLIKSLKIDRVRIKWKWREKLHCMAGVEERWSIPVPLLAEAKAMRDVH